MGSLAAIVVAGGEPRRFGADKLALRDAQGRVLLEVTVAGVAQSADPVIVVGHLVQREDVGQSHLGPLRLPLRRVRGDPGLDGVDGSTDLTTDQVDGPPLASSSVGHRDPMPRETPCR